MWIVYRKKDKKVVGLSADSDVDLAKDVALNEIVTGLPDAEALKNYDAVQVTDRAKSGKYLAAFPNNLVLRENAGGKLQFAIETQERCLLAMSCDAPDAHPVDGIPEIKADGKSFTTISVQKINEQGEPQQSKNDNDQLFLRTDFGALFSEDGKEAINSIKLKKGQAAFRLVSETNRRIASVQVFNSDPNLFDQRIRVEFI
jgi:hypothetical protein